MSEAPHTVFAGGASAPGTTLAEAGETALLERLVAIAQASGPAAGGGEGGDDAAVWTPPAGRDLAVSIDALVEEVDFRRSWITPRQLGRRAFAVAASDLAGSGADALRCVATLCARPAELLDDVLELQRGLCEAAAAVGCAVVGGDVSGTAGPLVIDVCVTGSLPSGRALRRVAGAAGDAVLVSGVLGRAAAGLRLLLAGAVATSTTEATWLEAQLQPVARLGEGQELLARGVRCGGDISDGLVIDASRTARASGCAVELWLDRLPVDAELAARFGDDWPELAAAGGEEFELLVTLPEADAAALLEAWPADLAPLTRVGVLVRGEGVRLRSGREGPDLALPSGRSEHFR